MKERPNILVVDDDVRYVELLTLTLESSGYQVTTALSGEEALVAAIDRPDLVVLDIVMPGIDGIRVAEQLRSVTGEGTPFVFLTAKGQPHHRLTGLGLGAAEYLTKPFDTEQLLSVIKDVLAHHADADLREES
jgi:DNA-binding response OmpR family regulator